jgi:hypothetical protein
VALFLQLATERTDVWQAQLQVFALMLLWMCCGTAVYSMGCSSIVSLQVDVTLDLYARCTTSLTSLQLTETPFFDAEADCNNVSSKGLQPNL